MTDDVKELLARALGDEPPLRIDRDKVLERGRKRLRRKRLIDTGSVVAAVVVAVVGATMLTNLGDGEPDRMPPAASSTEPAPQGPELPISTGVPRSSPETETTVSSAPPSASISGDEARRLSGLLYSAGIVSEAEAKPVPGKSGTPQFLPYPDRYTYEADLYTPDASGYVQVVVGYASDIGGGCGAVSATPVDGECSIKTLKDVAVTLVHTDSATGERQTVASAKFRGGARIAVTASNITLRDAKYAKAPPGTLPVLTDDQLCLLVTTVGTSV